MIRSSVDLPAPLRPSTPILAPGQEAERDVLEHRLVRRMRPAQLVHRVDVLARHRARSLEPDRGRIRVAKLGPTAGASSLVGRSSRMRPLIGVTTSELRASALATTRRHGEPAHPEMALGMTYLRTLDAAGAIPVVLPPTGTDHLGALLDRLDGICLSGGPDLDPAAYGAHRAPRRARPDRAEPGRLRAQPRQARARARLPILAHLPRRAGAQRRLRRHAAPARRRPPPDRAGDPADARGRDRPRSRLHRIAKTRSASVNSFHHQAVDRLGDGLRVVGRARRTARSRRSRAPASSVGVQWHAETLVAHLPLFEALVTAAARTELRMAA